MTAPTITQIREAIAAVMATVDGIGVIHTRERYITDADGLRALYQDSDGKLRGWHIRRVQTARVSAGVGAWAITHRWEITGYSGFEDADASELAFDELIEALAEAVRLDETLSGVVATTVLDDQGERAGLQVDRSRPVMFCGVLCHQVVTSLFTRHFLIGE